MKSKTSFFNAGIYRNIIKRTWPLWAAYFLVWFFSMPLITLVNRMESAGTIPPSMFLPEYINGVADSLLHFSAVSGFVVAILAAMAVFNFMHSSRGSGLIASLPVRRETVFTSAYLAGLIPVIVIDFVIAALNLLSSLGAEVSFSVILNANLFWFVVNIMEYVTFYGIAVIIAMVTANNVALPVLYLIFNFLIIGMETVVNGIFSEFIFGYNNHSAALLFMSPFVLLMQLVAVIETDGAAAGAQVYHYFSSFNHWGMLFAYFAVGIVLSVIALLLYRRHRMESAGDVVAVPALRPVFKYGVAVCASLSFSVLFSIIVSEAVPGRTFDLIILTIGLIIGAFIGYFVSEMFIQKSLHVFKCKWRGFAVLAVLCVVFTFCTAKNVFGIATHLPDADDIEYAYTYEYNNVKFTDRSEIEELLRINRAVIAKGNEYMDLSCADETGMAESDLYIVQIDSICDAGRSDIEFGYVLKNGKTVYRSYTIPNDENYEAYRRLHCETEHVLQYFTPSVDVTAENISDAVISVYANPGLKDENGEPYVFVTPTKDDDGNVYSEAANIDLTPEQAVDFYRSAFIPDVEAGNIANPMVCVTGPTVLDVNISLFSENGPALDSFYVSIDENAGNCIRWLCDNFG